MRTKAFAIFLLLLALVGFCKDKAIAWGPITHMTILDDILRDPGLNSDVKKILQENLKHAKGGATGPDMYYFFDKRYADIAHYCSPGDFARKVLEMAKKDGDPKKIAFAYGWMIHVASDPIGHRWVNSLAGGAYDPKNSEIKSAHSNIEQSIDKRNLVDHSQPVPDPESGMTYYNYDTDIDSPDIFNFRAFSNFFECGDNAPPSDVGEVAENIAQLVYNAEPSWILGKDENQYNTAEYRDAYQRSVLAAIDGLNSSGGTLENWDLDTGEAPYIRDNTGEIIPNPNYKGYEKCNEYGQLKDCGPVSRSSAGNDHSDDTVSVGGGSSTSETLSLDPLYRLAPKKGKKWLLWVKAAQDANAEYNVLPPDAPAELRQEKLYKILALISYLNAPLNSREFSANNPQLLIEIEEVPDIAVLENGYFEEMTNLITRGREPVRTVSIDFSPAIVESQPVLVIPSGGLYGLENSEVFKASLDEYVKNGGTLIVFGQQHGYEFEVLPVPQEANGSYKKITGYGWSEDQSCQYRSSYIDAWHQILSGQSNATPNINVDGYFTDYPSNAIVLLRRTANGQPDLLMYEYGKGSVIVTSMYTDQALRMGQAFAEEIALVRDMISWAKKPAQLPEIMLSQTVSISVSVQNITMTDAASVKLLAYNPDRTTLLSTQDLNISIPAGQSATIPVTYGTTSGSALGIYHVDYNLCDSSGTIIQPQAETDSGRFAVSNPPINPYKSPDFGFSVQSDAEYYVYGSPATFTFILWNHTDRERQITVNGNLSHHRVWVTKTVNVPPKGSTSFNYILEQVIDLDRCFTWFYDENGKNVGLESKGIWVVNPSANITVTTDKHSYAKGETVIVNASLKNNINISWQPNVQIAVYDRYTNVFKDTKTLTLPPSGTGSISASFTLPSTSTIGSYLVNVQVPLTSYYAWAWTRFELPQTQILISPNLPSVFNPGTNTIPLTITNTGEINVSSGAIDLSLKAPDGSIVYSGSQPLSIAVGESKTLDVPISISSLKLGNYVLTYSQSDETRTGNPTAITIPNNASMALLLDKPSYRVRETANLTANITNTGKFNLENVSVTVSVPDANYTETRAIPLGIDPNSASLNFTIPIPETITAGQHNVNVTVTLSSGATLVKNTSLTVPESKLAIDYSGTTTLAAGDTINLTIENTGGVDTTYTAQKLSINDSHGVEIYHGSVTGTILSGEKKSLIDIQISTQAMNGPAYLHVQMRDDKTGKMVYYDKPIEIKGLSVSLQTMTAKNAYLNSEAITGISNILNGPYRIEGGSLKVSVTIPSVTEKFSHFLPKRGWWLFSGPSGLAIGPEGSVYVADTWNSQIEKFDRNGNFIKKWGDYGAGDGEFYSPVGIATSSDGSVYVADTRNNRIQKFDNNGNFITKWGNPGAGDGQFNEPKGMAVGPDGSIYVADTGNNRIQKFDNSGNFITKWEYITEVHIKQPSGIAVGSDGSVYVADTGRYFIEKFDSDGNFITWWGGWGTGDGQFKAPSGIVVGLDGFVYVTDADDMTFNHRIQKFDSNGNFVTQWGRPGVGDGEFAFPYGIAIDPDGSVFVADTWNNRIQKFDRNGNFIMKWGLMGSRDGELAYPEGIAVGSDKSIYVADSGNCRIQRFDGSGNFITKWGSCCTTDPNWDGVPENSCAGGQFASDSGIAIGPDGSVYVADTGNKRIQKFDSNGNFVTKWQNLCGEGECRPVGIAAGPDGSVYVANLEIHRIQKFDSDGNSITEWGEEGSGDGQFSWDLSSPVGIAVGHDGTVYVVDTNNNRIQKFDSNGSFITKWGIEGSGDGQFSYPGGITVAPDGSVYVADTWNSRIQKFDSNGNFLMKWESTYNTDYGDGEFYNPVGIAVTSDGSVFVVDSELSRVQIMAAGNVTETVFETSLLINQPGSSTQDYTTTIGTLNVAGKLYLQADLKNNLGQTIAQAGYPFYIVEGDTILKLNTDKKIYKPGEAATITGELENRATIEAVGLTLTINSKLRTPSSELLYTDSFDIPAGGIHPFMITTTAGAEGTVTLTGKVTQNNSTLVEIADQYEVAKPNVSVSASVPDVIGSEPFIINVEIRNTGKVDATVQFGVQSPDFGDSQTITIPPGEMKILQYSQQTSKKVTYTFTFTGDYQETIAKTITYGLGASIQFGIGGSGSRIFPEGGVAVPLTITNTGQLAENLSINFALSPGGLVQTKTYYLQSGANINDTLYFILTQGDYQITANSQSPNASTQADFSVRKENRVGMALSLGTQSDGLIPVNVNLTNNGFNAIEGTVQLSVINSAGATVWNGYQEISLPSSSTPSPSIEIFNINPSALPAGDYTLKAELLNNSSQQISFQNSSFGVQSPSFQITQLPPYQTFPAGQEATFTFMIKNTGNQEGPFELRLKAYDLIDSTQREWLKPNEEKAITFGFMLPEDLEEKDYFANYELKASVVAGQSKGQIKYHLAGIKLNVNASLDKPYYNEGETAHLTINIQSPNPNPQNLSVRANYAGYEPQQTFTLNGSQVLIFDVPLPKITGEKLFYGIYHESGRSIYLNSIYIHKAGDVITITTDKQVYNPGEVVSVSVSGNASGNMTLSGPGGYTETFTFTGSAAKSFTLPATVTAGTYFINAQLTTQTLNQVQGDIITVVHPFDVAGIQVKVLECQNDKGKYASSDTITTSFTISSNTSMPAILKAWIVDPTGQYTSVGENNINLSSLENSLVTYHSSLVTSVSGIHRLVYGIYGPQDLLLCSGSEAFDVGDAVLMGLSTDKRDYPTNTEPVIVTASMFGSVGVELQLELDSTVIKSEPISLNGFTTYTTQLQNIIPGPHTLKATLTSGELKSTKETTFTYALSFMPKPNISASSAYLDFGSLNLGSTSTKTVTLSSTGNVDLVTGSIALSGTNQGEFTIHNDNCSGRTIAPTGNCTLDVLFSPISLGAKSASLSIPSNATDTPTLNLSLGGAGATTLNLSINPSGGGKVTGPGIDCPGDCTESFSTSGAAIQLTATPTEGYRFLNWTGDINLAEDPVAVNMEANKNVTANFAITTYTINVTAGLGGTVSPSGSVTVNPGGSQTFTITPNPGYHIIDVTVDGISVGAVVVYTISNVTAGHTIEVSFAINQYTLTATAGQNGSIAPSGPVIVNHGGSQTFTITPNTGYRISDVKVDGVPIGVVTTYTFSNVIASHTIEVTFVISNSPPVADAGLDQNVITGQGVTLNGSKSYDPEGAMITFLWIFVEVPAGSSVTNASLSDVASAKPQFTPDVNGAYRLQLIVNDGTLNSVPDEVVINATTPNVPPNANAGPDQNVFTGNTVQLDGGRSGDPDNGPLPLSYLWSFVAKPAGSWRTDNNIADRNKANASFIPDVDGLYELKLTINDGNLSSEDTIQIVATLPNVPPNANAGADITVNLGNTAVLDGSASADPDHGPQPLTYLWSLVAVPTGSQLTNGAISGANTVSPSFTPDVEGTYVLQLMVFDGTDAGFDNVAVTVGTKRLSTLAPVKVWLGLKNSDDQGTYFDLRVDLLKNGVTIATGETTDIRGITRNPSLAKEVTVAFGSISDSQLNSGDVLSLRIMTKVTALGGHSNAVGLRLYYDGMSRPSRFGMEIIPDPLKDYFLHSNSSGDFLNNLSPTATDAKYKDSASVNRTTYKEIGTWRFTAP